jgi:peptidoglycan/xylan/chitin deacetylase (PgdA/CDA1 family)
VAVARRLVLAALTLAAATIALSTRRTPAVVAVVTREPTPIAAPPVPRPEAALPLPVAAVSFGPEGDHQPASTALTIAFDGPIDREELAITLEPPAEVALSFPDERTAIARPARLLHGTAYRVSVTGRSAGGVPILPFVWSFRTSVPAPGRVVPGEGARAVLTFDDGSRTRTEGVRLLDLLRSLEVRAILFPTGDWARKFPDLFARAKAEGHLVCNHTRTHRNLTTLPDAEVIAEIEGGAGHGECALLRPPSMGNSPRVEAIASRLGYRMFLWDIDSRDWEGLPADDLENAVLGSMRPDSVVLLHMHQAQTFAALPSLVARLRAAGYVLDYGDVASLQQRNPASYP